MICLEEFPQKVDFEISACTEGPNYLLSDYVRFIVHWTALGDENSGFEGAVVEIFLN